MGILSTHDIEQNITEALESGYERACREYGDDIGGGIWTAVMNAIKTVGLKYTPRMPQFNNPGMFGGPVQDDYNYSEVAETANQIMNQRGIPYYIQIDFFQLTYGTGDTGSITELHIIGHWIPFETMYGRSDAIDIKTNVIHLYYIIERLRMGQYLDIH